MLAVMAQVGIKSTPAHRRSDSATSWGEKIEINMNGRTPITGELPDTSADLPTTQTADTTDIEEICPTVDTEITASANKTRPAIIDRRKG
jgi:hypothetical protein